MDELTKTIAVVDNGSCSIKAGFAFDDAPRKIFSSVVGYSKKSPINDAMVERNYYCGEDAKDRRGRLRMVNPIQDSIIQNWDDIENLWSHTFYEVLKISPEDCLSVITESPLNPKKYREKSIEILFELFDFEGVYLINKSILSLYASGRSTGCVVDSGYGVSYIVPVFEGYMSPKTVLSLNLGGRHLDKYLNSVLTTLGYEFTTSLELEIVSEIKEKLCVMKEEAKFKANPNDFKEYQLPDDSIVRISSQRYDIPEAIFNPSTIGINEDGIHETLFKSILRCSEDIQNEMYGNIILSGGNTMFENFKKRLYGEIVELNQAKNQIDVIELKERLYSSWIGGSVIGSMDTFPDICISRDEFKEFGCKIVHDKTY
ncbi:MAG: actin family protein [archaeon]|nr:actin family protein [archaeon]